MSYRRQNLAYCEGEQIKATNAYKAAVEKYAEEVATAAGFHVGDNPTDLVKQLGGRVHYENLEDLIRENGSIFVHGQFDFDILLPEYTSPRRDRFTIAHELGHYFLHAGQGEVPIIAFRQGSTRIEWEANWFAAALLMPALPFKQACRKSGSNNIAIAEQFGVSEDAVAVRRKALDA